MIIFDIDQTLIDSSYRENKSRCANSGSLNLPEYIRLKSLISYDEALPLGKAFKSLKESKILTGCDWRILTARTFDARDFASLSALLGFTSGDYVARVIRRDNIAKWKGNPTEQDSGKYKKPVLDYLAGKWGKLTVIDDCPSVIGLTGNFQTFSAYDFYSLTEKDCRDFILSC